VFGNRFSKKNAFFLFFTFSTQSREQNPLGAQGHTVFPWKKKRGLRLERPKRFILSLVFFHSLCAATKIPHTKRVRNFSQDEMLSAVRY